VQPVGHAPMHPRTTPKTRLIRTGNKPSSTQIHAGQPAPKLHQRNQQGSRAARRAMRAQRSIDADRGGFFFGARPPNGARPGSGRRCRPHVTRGRFGRQLGPADVRGHPRAAEKVYFRHTGHSADPRRRSPSRVTGRLTGGGRPGWWTTPAAEIIAAPTALRARASTNKDGVRCRTQAARSG